MLAAARAHEREQTHKANSKPGAQTTVRQCVREVNLEALRNLQREPGKDARPVLLNLGKWCEPAATVTRPRAHQAVTRRAIGSSQSRWTPREIKRASESCARRARAECGISAQRLGLSGPMRLIRSGAADASEFLFDPSGQ